MLVSDTANFCLVKEMTGILIEMLTANNLLAEEPPDYIWCVMLERIMAIRECIAANDRVKDVSILFDELTSTLKKASTLITPKWTNSRYFKDQVSYINS